MAQPLPAGLYRLVDPTGVELQPVPSPWWAYETTSHQEAQQRLKEISDNWSGSCSNICLPARSEVIATGGFCNRLAPHYLHEVLYAGNWLLWFTWHPGDQTLIRRIPTDWYGKNPLK